MARSRNASAVDQPSLFGPAEQQDLFEDAKPMRYIPKPEYVRPSLADLIATLAQAQTWWDWTDHDVEYYRFGGIDYFCNLLPDLSEREAWRVKHRAEVERLDAASAPQRPYDPRFFVSYRRYLIWKGMDPEEAARLTASDYGA